MIPVAPRWVKLTAVVAFLALIVPLATAGTAAQDGGKILRVHHIGYPEVVDPQKSSVGNEIDILALAYEGLTRLNSNQETVAGAAISWEYNEDATQITFHLRDGMTYSDGSPLTAENFRYAAERTCDPNTAGEYQYVLTDIVGCDDFAGLALDDEGNAREFTPEEYEAARAALGVRALDDLTLQFDLAHPAPYFHTIAGLWVLYPVKQEIVAVDPDNWWKSAENHIGNGPFKVTGVEEDQRWSFAANENYWQGRPLLDSIEYLYVDEVPVAIEAYRAGDLDIVVLDAIQTPAVMNDPELAPAFVSYPLAGTHYLAMSLDKEPFSDPKVRQAFSYAIDRETLCLEVMSGTCAATLSFMPPGTPGAIETDAFGFDPDAARQALAESTYGGPENLPEIKLYYNSDYEDRAQQSEWIAGEIRDILGVELVLEPMEGTALVALRSERETFPQMMYFGSWYQDFPDPQNWLSSVYTCESSLNRFGYCNEEFDRLTQLGDSSGNPAERIQYYEQAGQILVNDVPGPFLYNPTGTFLVSPTVTGYTPAANEFQWPGSFGSLMTLDKTG